MSGDKAQDTAERIYAEEQAKAPMQALPDGQMPADADEAYAVQDRLQRLQQAGGTGAIAGWKVALTSKVMQELVGFGRPCEGAIYNSRIHRSPATVRHGDFVNIGVESEIAVRLSRDLPPRDAPYGRADIEAAVAACMAAIEIVDDRAMNYKQLNALQLIAANSFNAGCVLGPEVADWQRLDLAALPGRMRINGEVVGEGVGGDALGHPLEPVVFLANNLIARGHMLKAGDVVLTGSIVATKWLKPGDVMATEVDGLGEASLTAA